MRLALAVGLAHCPTSGNYDANSDLSFANCGATNLSSQAIAPISPL
jgi:hypothetical protein